MINMKKILDARLGLHILELEITSRCNLNCQHCYNRTGKNVDMPLRQIKKLYDFAGKNKIWTFIISGGEALLHPNFSRILDILQKKPKNLRLVLQSNGELISEKIFSDLKIFDWVHLSFDLSKEIRHNGWKNLELAKALKRHGIKAYLFATIHNKNKNDLDKMIEVARKNSIPIGFNLCMSAAHLDKKLVMTKKNFMLMEKKLFKLNKQKIILRYSSPLVSILDESKRGEFKGIEGGCTAGIAACVVAPNGDVYPCPFFRIKAGNINEKSLKSIWLKSDLLNIVRDREGYDQPCSDCDRLSYCGGCRNRAYQENNNLRASDPMCYKF